MSTNPRYANGNARRKLQARMAAEGMPCHLCGYPIMYECKYPHRQSFVMDEYQCVRDGGSVTSRSNVFPAHACCNSWRGCKDVTEALRATIRARYEREVLHIGRQPQETPQRVTDGFY